MEGVPIDALVGEELSDLGVGLVSFVCDVQTTAKFSRDVALDT